MITVTRLNLRATLARFKPFSRSLPTVSTFGRRTAGFGSLKSTSYWKLTLTCGSRLNFYLRCRFHTSINSAASPRACCSLKLLLLRRNLSPLQSQSWNKLTKTPFPFSSVMLIFSFQTLSSLLISLGNA